MPRELPEALLRQLSPSNVRWYAVRAGWKPVNGVKRPVIVLNHPTDDLTQIQIPTAGSDKEFAYLMGEAVERLAEAERRPAREVLSDLAMPTADMLRLAVQSRDAETGTLPLDEGLNLWKGGRDLILAAACSAHRPQAYYPRQSFSVAQDYLRGCRLGQSERGSYVATILAPVPPELSPSLFGEVEDDDLAGEPYERRVTLLLMQGLQTVRNAIAHGDSESLLHGTERGVSANLCEALASMNPADARANVHISMNWSRARPRVPKTIPPRVSFAQSEFAIIREAGRRLRERVEPHRERLEGSIIGLHAEPGNVFEEFKGKVVVRALIGGKPARVQFELTHDEYAAACDAHRDRRRVTVSGTLQRDPQAKFFDLLQARHFRVLPPEGESS